MSKHEESCKHEESIVRYSEIGLLEFLIWFQIFGKHFEGSDLYQLFIELFRNAYTKFGDCEKYEPQSGFSFAPGGPGAIFYNPQPICS